VADPNTEMGRFFGGQPLWASAIVWTMYLALEPYVRKFWPATVVSWSRLMARQWRDPLVGRDILFGVSLGLLVPVIDMGSGLAVQMLGHAVPPRTPSLDALLGTRYVLAEAGNQILNAPWPWPSPFSPSPRRAASSTVRPGASALTGIVLIIAVMVLAVKYLGLLSVQVLFLVNLIVSSAAFTLDPSKWFFADSLLPLLVPAVMAGYGFYASRGGEPVIGRRLLD